MNKRKAFLVILSTLILIVGLVASNISWWQVWGDKVDETERLKKELGSLQTIADDYRQEAQGKKSRVAELSSNQTELSNSQAELSRIQTELSNSQAELSRIQTDLENTQDERDAIRADKQELETAKSDMETYYKNELVEEFQKGKEAGYAEILEQEALRHNPTYNEMWGILRELSPEIDKGISEIRESVRQVSCSDWAVLVNNLVEDKGLRTGVVFLVYKYVDNGKWGHFLNSFETSDRGMVYMDYFFRSFDVKGAAVGNYYLGFSDSLIKEVKTDW